MIGNHFDLLTKEDRRILHTPGRDYPWRVEMGQDIWAVLLGRLAKGIDYSDFKAAVEPERGELYGRVWEVMTGLEAKRFERDL